MQFEIANLGMERYMKERLSLIELVMRERQTEVAHAAATLEQRAREAEVDAVFSRSRGARVPGDAAAGVRAGHARLVLGLDASVEELHTRFQQARLPLSYHNGYFQVVTDALIEAQLVKPFWDVIADPLWQNVAADMSEALDRRDSGAGDAAWYACKALESTIKIVSDRSGWSTGRENGAHSFIDNLVSDRQGVRYIEVFEMDVLKPYFSKVRNQFGHGPGNQAMPNFNRAQTDWAIEFAMSWVRTLARRLPT